MPVAIVLVLRPTQPGRLVTLERAAHAAVLELIGQQQADLIGKLHDVSQLRPLTVAMVPEGEAPTDNMSVTPTHRYALRITLLDPIVEHLADRWLAGPPETLGFAGVIWEVERIADRPSLHQRAGRITYGQLVERGLHQAQRQGQRWTLEFVTPVTFRQRGMNQPLPTAELVFGSLLDRWQAWSPVPLPTEVRELIRNGVAISQFALRAVMVTTKGRVPQVGAIGHCTYLTTRPEPLLVSCVETLANFAPYSGVGAGTTRGFGQTRLLIERPAGLR